MTATPTLGLRANAGQFALLVGVNALVGAMLGQERALLPLLGTAEHGVTSYTAALTFVVAFGVAKAATNLVAGTLADRIGRKPVLLAGWAIALPVPLLILAAPGWSVVVLAMLLLGISQGLAWSMTVTMKVDLVGPRRRGLALGLNESAGYLAVAGASVFAGYLAGEHGLRPWPFLVALAYAGAGLVVSALFVRETHAHTVQEGGGGAAPTDTFRRTSYRDPQLGSACQAGLVNNLNDGMSWGIFPLLFAAAGLPLHQVGLLLAIYPAVWGIGQAATGALADALPRDRLVAGGMLVQAVALVAIALNEGFLVWMAASALLGLGTALVYPTLLAVVSDAAHPSWRGRALGTYRFWRDLGLAAGALVAGPVADLVSAPAAILVVAALTALSGLHAGRHLSASGAQPGRRTHR